MNNPNRTISHKYITQDFRTSLFTGIELDSLVGIIPTTPIKQVNRY